MIRARLAERVSRGRAVTVPGRDRLEIVWIEQAPLRANAAGECTDMMARLEQARLCWHQFERQDKPAFVRWRSREFGALLSTARDVEDKIRDAQNLIHEVEMEMRRKIQDPHSAYRRVLFRRDNPGVAEDRKTSSNGSQSTSHLSEFEQEALLRNGCKHFWARTRPRWMTTLIRPALKFLNHICSLGREVRRVDPIPDRRMSGVLRSMRNPRNRERLIRG